MNGDPNRSSSVVSGSAVSNSSDARSRNKRRDDQIRKKVEQELARRTKIKDSPRVSRKGNSGLI
jgi:hypothetical protein